MAPRLSCQAATSRSFAASLVVSTLEIALSLGQHRRLCAGVVIDESTTVAPRTLFINCYSLKQNQQVFFMFHQLHLGWIFHLSQMEDAVMVL